MKIIDQTVLSDDIFENYFVCNLNACKGACCVEGDAGAPLENEELPILEEIYPAVKPYLSKEGIQIIEEKGLFEVDSDGDFCTTTIGNKECVFAIYDEHKTLHCGIEKAYKDGEIEFQKPISCHLYPIRITKTQEFELLNYSRWDICNAACDNGKKLKVPLYQFLKAPLIRKYGENWYKKLLKTLL
jgi:hypothetical protein